MKCRIKNTRYEKAGQTYTHGDVVEVTEDEYSANPQIFERVEADLAQCCDEDHIGLMEQISIND